MSCLAWAGFIMVIPRRKKYRAWNPEAYAQQALSPADRLPEDDLVFFLLDVVPQLDLDAFYESYELETRGQPPFDPTMLVCLLLYSYCVGVYSSRKIAQACERNLAFLAIVGDDRPDFRTISDFRKEHLHHLAELFVQVLKLAAQAGMVRLGNLAFDGSKFTGQASRHKAMSYGYMIKEEQRLKAEIEALLQQAGKTDSEEDALHGSRRGDELPEELKRREDRLAVIAAAKARLEEQARAAAEEERQRRAEEEAQRQRDGKKRRGKEPAPPSEVPKDSAQCSFSDPEMKIMPQSNKGWDYATNAQIGVDGEFQIIVACYVTDASNDKEQAIPLAQATMENFRQAGVALPKEENGEEKKIPATLDSGYYSENAAKGMEKAGFDPYMATGRQKHNQGKAATTTTTTQELPETASVKEKMQAKVNTPEGKKVYARRKTIVEPVFGQVKGARGFRRFSFRGLLKNGAEWCLMCLTHNLLKIWRHQCALEVI
jgi:transposase